MKWVENLFSDWIWRLPEGSSRIAVTFDDGPSPETTPKLLDALDKSGIISTHFVTGSSCAANAAILRDMISRGHAVSNHGYFHDHHALHGREYQENSIRRTHDALLKAGVEPVRFFRPPYGSFNWRTSRVLQRLDYCGVMWSAMAGDWKPQSAEQLWNRIYPQLHDGAILVLHDGHPMTQTVIDILPRIAETAVQRGWQFATPADFLPHSTTLAECC